MLTIIITCHHSEFVLRPTCIEKAHKLSNRTRTKFFFGIAYILMFYTHSGSVTADKSIGQFNDVVSNCRGYVASEFFVYK